jgi:hypothetical protein
MHLEAVRQGMEAQVKMWQLGALLGVLGLLLMALRKQFVRMKSVGIRFFGFSAVSADRTARVIAWIGVVGLIIAGIALVLLDLLG